MMNRIAAVFTMALVTAIPAQDTNSIEPTKLTSLRNSWNQAKEAKALPIKEAYLAALAKLRDELTKRGELEDALLVRTEIGFLVDGVDHPAETPKKPHQLARLRGNFEHQMKELFEELDGKYLKALEAMKRRFMKEARLDAALSVEQEIKRLSGRHGTKTLPPKAKPREGEGAVISVRTSDKIRIRPLKVGEPRLYDSNPLRVIEGVSKELDGWEFTSIPQRNINSYTLTVRKPGDLYCFAYSRTSPAEIFGRDASKWIPASGAIRGINIKMCYKRSCEEGERIRLEGFEVQLAAKEILE